MLWHQRALYATRPGGVDAGKAALLGAAVERLQRGTGVGRLMDGMRGLLARG
jgi:hypothetical protein